METLVNNELINEAFITFSETCNTGQKKENSNDYKNWIHLFHTRRN